MLEIDSNSRIAGNVADKWALLITRSFAGDSFDYKDYLRAFLDVFGVKTAYGIWGQK